MQVPLLYYAVLSVITLTHSLTWGELTHKLAETGWITYPKDAGGAQFWQVYELYDLFPWRQEAVEWGILLRIFPITLALFFVVTFGSCLDITAIQANLSYEVRARAAPVQSRALQIVLLTISLTKTALQVDYNAELVTVGLSNMLTGVLGAGFTGSYIFSQTTFTQRSGCEHRLNGYIVVAAELLLFLVPMSFVQYLPNFYYGAPSAPCSPTCSACSHMHRVGTHAPMFLLRSQLAGHQPAKTAAKHVQSSATATYHRVQGR